jgi:hypothetical protein
MPEQQLEEARSGDQKDINKSWYSRVTVLTSVGCIQNSLRGSDREGLFVRRTGICQCDRLAIGP